MQAQLDQQVPGRRRARISKLKTVAGTLLDLQNDITDPITQVSSLEHLSEHSVSMTSLEKVLLNHRSKVLMT